MRKVWVFALIFFILAGSTWAKNLGETPNQKLPNISQYEKIRQRVIVRYRSTRTMDRLLSDRKIPSPIRKKFRRFAMMATDLSEEEAAVLATDPDVLYIEPDITFYLDNRSYYRHLSKKLRKGRFYDPMASFGYQWASPIEEYQYNLANMGVTKAFHDAGYLGQGIKVGVIDTGIDGHHPDLDLAKGLMLTGGIETSDSNDVFGHGTHVAGIIAAKRNGFGIVGMAPEVELYSLRVFTNMGTATLSNVIDAVQWAIDHKLHILNMSFGTTQYSEAFREVLECAYDAGILLVAAAGNAGPSVDNVEYPARYDMVVAVSAIDEDNGIADFSSQGPAIEVAAPGVDILSTFNTPPYYEYLSGTSMACPHVVGLAALIMSANPGISNEEVRRRLSAFAKDLGPAGRDSAYGWGIPQVDRDPSSPDKFAPVAVAGGPYQAAVGDPVHFLATGTLDMDDNFLSYEWDFGDGNIGQGPYSEHVYQEPGDYMATLTVWDQDGLEGVAQTQILVHAGVKKAICINTMDENVVYLRDYLREPSRTHLYRKVTTGREPEK